MRVTQMDAFSQSKYRYPEKRAIIKKQTPPAPVNAALSKFRDMFKTFETDDYILAGILIVLILEGCDDYILLATLGYLFIMGFKEVRNAQS